MAGLQGEVGASAVEGRDMKIKLSFARYMTKTSNGLLAPIYGKLIKEQRPGRWVKQFREYLGELGLDFCDVETGEDEFGEYCQEGEQLGGEF